MVVKIIIVLRGVVNGALRPTNFLFLLKRVCRWKKYWRFIREKLLSSRDRVFSTAGFTDLSLWTRFFALLSWNILPNWGDPFLLFVSCVIFIVVLFIMYKFLPCIIVISKLVIFNTIIFRSVSRVSLLSFSSSKFCAWGIHATATHDV